MKKFFLINLFVVLGLSFTQGIDDTTKDKCDVNPTSITTRSKFFKTYLHDDTSLFKEMSKWHEEDYAALAQAVKLDANQIKLKLIYDTLNKVFDNGTVTHSKIAAAYTAYSCIISSKSEMELQGDTEDARDEETVNDIIQEVIAYCIDNKIREYHREFHTNDEALSISHIRYNIVQITLADKYNVRWLPYVSQNGLSTFRILNTQFGMKAPLIGLPLARSSFDGNLNMTPSQFFHHDMNHGGFFDANNITPAVINFIYDCYQEADTSVSQLTDTKIQALCDFFLFQVGHELFFNIETTWDNDYRNEHRTFTIQHPKDINEACDKVLKYLEENILKLYQPSPLHSLWDKDRETILLPFVNPNREGQQLFSLMELIHDFKLDRGRPLSEKEITPRKSGFLSTLPPHSFTFDQWYRVELNLQFYNQLFGYKYFFNQNGIGFDLWKGDIFQTDTIIAVFKEACDTFKTEVGTRFKGFDNLSTKNWQEKGK